MTKHCTPPALTAAGKVKTYSYLRYSTAGQGEAFGGDSVRRQNELIKRFLERNNAEIVESIEDLGISSFRGKNSRNIKTAAFAKFLEKVRQGQIEKGSILIVEGFDRISRQNGFDTIEIITNILRQKIKIHTLSDGKTYDIEDANQLEQLILIAVINERAHNESKTKSERSLSNWEGKRQRINSEKQNRLATGVYPALTKNCPFWLTINESGNYALKQQAVEQIKELLELLSQRGVGAKKAAKLLNEAENPAKNWNANYILHLLRNDMLIGHYQPVKAIYDSETSGMSYAKNGEKLENVYPAVVTENELNYVRNVMFERKAKGGKKQNQNENIFAGIAKCAHCGNSLRFQKLGGGDTKYRYLVCLGSERGQCVSEKTLSTSYNAFLANFFKASNHFDFDKVIKANKSHDASQQKNKLLSIATELETAQKAKASLSKMLDSLLESGGEIPDTYTTKILAAEKRVKQLEKERDIAQFAVLEEERRTDRFVKADASFLESLESDEMVRIRTNTLLSQYLHAIYFRNGKLENAKDSFYMTLIFRNGTVLSFNQHFDKLKEAAPLLDVPINVFEHGYTIEGFINEKVLDVPKA